jgi:multidrug resistance efflux pump
VLELLLCSLVTVVPDYLYRRYVQDKRIGREITLYSVWFELRWGITGCLVLTVLLITLIFYYHPSTTNAASFFRTVPIVPETGGRVAEVHVGMSEEVEAGEPLFTLDDSMQRAEVETLRRRLAEIDASAAVARTERAAADGRIRQARGAFDQALEELETKSELRARNPDAVPLREIERLENLVEGRQGALEAAQAEKAAVEERLATLLPAERARAEAQLAEAQVALDKTVVRAGVSGRVEQFTLRAGDFVSPLMRPAGVLIPAEAGRRAVQAGFGQIEAQVLHVGMVAEVTCAAKPLAVIPMVVTGVQEYIAGGQFGAQQSLFDVAEELQAGRGTILVNLEPLYEGGLEGLPPGSSCVANAYTDNHALLASEEMGFAQRTFLHVVDTVGIVHAVLLRIQALLLPVKTLVLSGH